MRFKEINKNDLRCTCLYIEGRFVPATQKVTDFGNLNYERASSNVGMDIEQPAHKKN